MKTLKHTLSALALVILTAGASLAGPSNPASSFTGTAGNTRAGGCPMIKAETRLAANANHKAGSPVQQITGFRHEGCTTSQAGHLVCQPSGVSCSHMRQS